MNSVEGLGALEGAVAECTRTMLAFSKSIAGEMALARVTGVYLRTDSICISTDLKILLGPSFGASIPLNYFKKSKLSISSNFHCIYGHGSSLAFHEPS